MYSIKYTKTQHGVTAFKVDGIVKMKKIDYLKNGTIKDYIFRSFHFLAELTFKKTYSGTDAFF